MKIFDFLTIATEMIFPQVCSGCNRLMDCSNHDCLCEECCSVIQSDIIIRCPKCDAPLPDSELLGDSDCYCCNPAHPRIGGLIALAQYHRNKKIKEMLLSLKHSHRTPVARALGSLLAERIKEYVSIESIDGVAAVPLHWARKIRRGFNQAELLSDYVSKQLKVPNLSWLLQRNRRTLPQKGSPQFRKQNVNGAFRSRGICDNAHLVLVDDVFTTGATTSSCTQTLYDAGAALVTIAVCAWVPKENRLEA
jgi:ComF family protein